MIDADGYRANVGIILSNQQGQVLWAKRLGRADAWQFPQGGMQVNESAEQALFRELEEEVGLNEQHVEILAVTDGWLRYNIPEKLVRHNTNPVCIGQKQKWFLLKLTAAEEMINVNTPEPEFDGWRWVDYWYPLEDVVDFKREVYRQAMEQLEAHIS